MLVYVAGSNKIFEENNVVIKIYHYLSIK